jgi:hypothetical protein
MLVVKTSSTFFPPYLSSRSSHILSYERSSIHDDDSERLALQTRLQQ